jgi:Ala-tRNA(Pro) deacylase
MPKTPDEILSMLSAMGIRAPTVRHPPLHTVAESQALRGEIPGGHTKNLFLRDKGGQYFLVTVEENATIDLKRIHHAIGATGRVSFGRPEAMMELLGVTPGAVTLLGLVNDTQGKVRIVLDAALLRQTAVNVHPLTNEATTSIAPADLLRFLDATGHRPLVLNLAG